MNQRISVGRFLGTMAVYGCVVSVCSGTIAWKTSAEDVLKAPDTKEEWPWIAEDPKPAHLASNSHYLVSNENHQDQFLSVLSNKKGGAYVGVGADQNYLLAGWAQPSVMVLMDFDQMVVDLHKVYRVAFLHAESKDAFLDLWRSKKGRKEMEALIVQMYGKRRENREMRTCQMECKAVRKAYRTAMIHQMVPRRLSWMERTYRKKGIPTFLTDDGKYEFIRALYRRNAVKMVRGDLGKETLGSVGDALRKKNLNLQVLYLSNAEKYFLYEPHFSSIMKAMPMDKNSLILHTWALRNEGNRYAYFVQTGNNFVSWLSVPKVKTVRNIIGSFLRGIRHGRYGSFPHPLFLLENQPELSSDKPSKSKPTPP